MNSGIAILEDGTPCFVHDDKDLPLITHFEFSHEDFQIVLVWKDQKTDQIQRLKMEYPLEESFVKILKEQKMMGIAEMQNGTMNTATARIIPVVFSIT